MSNDDAQHDQEVAHTGAGDAEAVPPAHEGEAAEAAVNAHEIPKSPSGVWDESRAEGEADVVAGEREVDESGGVKPTKPDSYSAASPTIPALASLADVEPLPPNTHAPDSPTTLLLDTLRSQISILTDQSTALNSKLIASVSRVSNLEDSLDAAGAKQRALETEKGELERQKAEWELSMQTGLLVERGQVRDEMQRLVEGLVEEEKRRGSAEEGRKRVEREVDDLSASLFEQANTMVASERMFRLRAETQLKEAEANLSIAESAVQQMQQHLQSLPSLLLPAPDMSPSGPSSRARQHLSTCPPHLEFQAFLAHLRQAKPQHSANATFLVPPVVSVLLSQPFLARTQLEDHDPTLRLDIAPDLNWLSRRSVNSAILAGELTIEPVGAGVLLSSASYANASGEIGCSMCGKPVFASQDRGLPGSPAGHGSGQLPPPAHPAKRGSTGGTARFSLKPFFNSPASSNSRPASPSASPLASPAPTGAGSLPPVYVFRIAPSTTTTTTTTEKEKESRLYPLCHSGWCLTRLRATCELWRFVRTGIIEVVWKGEDGWAPPTPTRFTAPVPSSSPAPPGHRSSLPALPVRRVSEQVGAANSPRESKDIGSELGLTSPGVEKEKEQERPELPPRKRSGISMAGWGLGFKFGSGRNSGATTEPEPGMEQERGEGEAEDEGAKVEELAGDAEGAKEEGEAAEEVTTKEEEVGKVDDAKEPTTEQLESTQEAKDGELGHPEDNNDAPAQKTETSAHGSTLAAPPLRSPEESDVEGEGHFHTPQGGSSTNLSPVEPESAELPEPVEGKDSDAHEVKGEESTPPTPITPVAASMETLDHPSRPGTPSRPARRTVPPAPGSPVVTGSTPPPIPSRAPRRPVTRPSSIVTGSADQAPLDSATPTPVTPRIDVPDTPEVPTTPVPEASTVDLTESSIRSPPPLPDRTPKNPPARHSVGSVASLNESSGKKDSKFVEGSGWDVKTWKELVRLKEEMWKARLGVVEGEDE